MKTATALAAVFASLAVGLTPERASALTTRSCGTFSSTNTDGGNGIFGATARGVGCTASKRVLSTFFRRGGTAGERPRVPGWSCRNIRSSPGRAAYRCSHDGATATAFWTNAYD